MEPQNSKTARVKKHLPVILLVEDDPDDQELSHDALSLAAPPFLLQIENKGKHALAYLEGCSRNVLPSLVILDYNLPEMTGAEMLMELRKKDCYKEIPIVVFSTSDDPKFKTETLSLGAKAYIKKPRLFYDLVEKVEYMVTLLKK